MGQVRILQIALLAAATAGVAGCGSKISEANYYKVQHGMTEEDVDDLLGPPHGVGTGGPALSAAGAATQPATAPARAAGQGLRTVKTWTRGRLTIRVEFDNGIVIGRSAVGLPLEDAPRRQGPATPVALGDAD